MPRRSEAVSLGFDQYGRLPVTLTRAFGDGPSFTILNGATASNEIDPNVAWPQANLVLIYDAAGRLAAEVISLQVASVAAPAAGDWRTLTASILAGTTGLAVAPNAGINIARRVRLLSSVAVGGDRVFATTYGTQ